MRFAKGLNDTETVIHSDEQRERMYLDTIPKECSWMGQNAQELAEFFYEQATETEKEKFGSSSNFYDAAYPIMLRVLKGWTPMNRDLFRGQHEAAIAYVNGGANDFNSAEIDASANERVKSSHANKEDIELFVSRDPKALERFYKEGRILPPSLLVVGQFCEMMADTLEACEHGQMNQREIIGRIDSAGDCLYIYSKLKERGLYEVAIESRLKRFPNEKAKAIKETFKQMDKLLDVPEAQRFDEFNPLIQYKSEEGKNGNWNDLLKKAVAAYRQKQQGKKLATPQKASFLKKMFSRGV